MWKENIKNEAEQARITQLRQNWQNQATADLTKSAQSFQRAKQEEELQIQRVIEGSGAASLPSQQKQAHYSNLIDDRLRRPRNTEQPGLNDIGEISGGKSNGK